MACSKTKAKLRVTWELDSSGDYRMKEVRKLNPGERVPKQFAVTTGRFIPFSCPECGNGGHFICSTCNNLVCWSGSGDGYCPVCDRTMPIHIVDELDMPSCD